ncbi:MAG TPA: sigma-70 family RNA polymerase sigma factor [Solirubrobacter sp.]|nr:sigma-70 family RNA polymerase sigma factor [Solirubrobacter sp.]
MEASALQHAGVAGLHGRSPLLRLQSDERLVGLIRRGNHHAFEALVARYQSRLLAFCRHMLSSREDAEDVLQEVFAAAFNAMLADEREINVRPWLYRIARNRSLNHLRRTQAVGMDSMDVHLSEGGLTTADKVHKREEFRLLISDVQDLPETQRTALLLREIDALSYEQIAEAMETTVPSVKSLLVRARVSLAEAAEARLLSCDEVRLELGEVAEGLKRTSPPVRRHLRTCERCTAFRKQLRQTNKALAALLPVGPLLLLKKTLLAHLGTATAAGGGTAAASGGATVGAGAAIQVGFGTIASKTAAGLAAAAIVTAGAVEVKHASKTRTKGKTEVAKVAPAPTSPPAATPVPTTAPLTVASAPQPDAAEKEKPAKKPQAEPKREDKAKTLEAKVTATPSSTPTASATPAEGHGGDTTSLPTDTLGTAQSGNGSYTPTPPPPPSNPVLAQVTPQPQPQTPPPPAATTQPEVTPTPETPPAPDPTPTPVQTPAPTPSPETTPTPETPPQR